MKKRTKECLRERRIKDINEMSVDEINDEIRLFEETLESNDTFDATDDEMQCF